ncbi:MAG: zf-HC2 domain-containing protein [Chloroflexi bacterium]|nr:zf-HC2 domain-containing protein [Chloroflexota bacterium]
MNKRKCGGITEAVSAYMDDELTTEERALVEAHLRDCPSCAARLAEYQKLQVGLYRYVAAIPSPRLRQANIAHSNRKSVRSAARDSVTEVNRFSMPRLVGVAVAIVIILGLALVASSYFPGTSQFVPAVQAQEILEKAAKVARTPAASGIHSLEMTSAYWAKRVEPRFGRVGTEMRSETHTWWQTPNRWRRELKQTAPPEEAMAEPDVSVSDGQSVWDTQAGGKGVTINAWEPQMDILHSLPAFEAFKVGSTADAMNDLESLFHDLRVCYDPELLPEESVAGRAAYVVDLGPTKCPSASAASMNGRRIIWVDKETFFQLKSEQYGVDPSQGIIVTSEVTSIRFNGDMDPQLFTFTPAADATVQDYRPKPAPSADEFQYQIEQIAKQADFPVFIPQYVPRGLKPRQPRLNPTLGIQLAYVPPDEVEKSSPDRLIGIGIVQQRATSDMINRWTQMAETVSIGNARGWLRRGVRNADGTGSNSSVLVLRDGTLVSIGSFALSPEELLEVAESLQQAPGSHAPLPNPGPQTLAEIRGRVSFPVFVPTDVPAGLTPEPPIGGERSISGVRINYHAADGGIQLTVFNAPAGSGMDADQRKSGQPIALPNAITAHFFDMQPQYGGPILWWQQDGAYVALSGPHLSKDDLIKIAGSMSNIADLGRPETPAARPKPTPVPTPKFTILRPTWLPARMTVGEQYEPGMPEHGSSVVLGFDPRPEDTQPHDVLTLREMPKAQVGRRGNPDPQETHETIGGRDVTIVHRGDNCIALSWMQGDVALTLTNPYDPPGQPKYSCDDLRKIVASIQ